MHTEVETNQACVHVNMKSPIWLFVVLTVTTVNCDDCVTYDFYSNYEGFDFNSKVCEGMHGWSLGNYQYSGFQPINDESELFITPTETLTCVSSYNFEVKSGGVVEIYVYMEAASDDDQVVVLMKEVTGSDNDAVAGSVILTRQSPNYVSGWHILRINVLGTNTFTGYLSFLGVKSAGSTVLVDSFRYIPPEFEEECNVYSDPITTVVPTTPFDGCVTYDFEEGFETKFIQTELCTNFQEWSLFSYSDTEASSPTSASTQYISPQDEISCTSSFVFDMEPSGVIEVNAYIEFETPTDLLTILVNTQDSSVVGTASISQFTSNFENGWNTLRVSLFGSGIFEGHVTFLGQVSENSVLIIDSFKYIPPQLSEEQCLIYEDDNFVTTTPLPIGTGEDCVTYDFEQNFESNFDFENQMCSGYSSWHLGTYYSLAIDSIAPESTTYITPTNSSSCVTSFTFSMLPGGTVEVNVFMDKPSDLDFIIVLAKKVVPGGIDTVVGYELYYGDNENFVEGWNVLKLTVDDFSTFLGYITLIGSTDEDSIVLIDSFRYVPPRSSVSCEIY